MPQLFQLSTFGNRPQEGDTYMPRRQNVYEITRKQPGFSWQKRTIKQAVYEALRELKRADVPKIIGTVMANGGFHTKQKDRDKQIRFTLWQFEREGVVRERADRRWRPRQAVLDVMASPKKRRRIG